jgi:myo-inositol-1(or 4)-monophosphatase
LQVTDAVDYEALGEDLARTLREAGALAQRTFQQPLKSWTKAHDSPVSEADIAVDDFLRARLTALLPGCAWLSEESRDDPVRLSSRRLWIVDPIDGTRAYIAGRADWAISVALVEAGRPVAAAIFAPVEDSLFLAAAGRGTTLNGAPTAASAGAALAHVRAAGPKPLLDRLAALAPGIIAEPKIHSLALRLARVAQGRLDVAFASADSNDWDLAAADLLVHEAGGALTTLQGHPLNYNRADPTHGALVAAGRDRHGTLVEAARTHGFV